MPKYEGKQNFSFLIIPKWMKSNACRKKEQRAKVSVNNGQYIRLNQQPISGLNKQGWFYNGLFGCACKYMIKCKNCKAALVNQFIGTH